MKTLQIRFILAVGVLATGFFSSAHATLLVKSNFDAGYTAGSSITGQSGSGDVNFAGTYVYTSSTATDSMSVASGGINYNSGSVVSDGGANAVDFKTTIGPVFSNVLARSFTSNITGQDVFASIVLTMVLAPSPTSDLYFSLSNGGAWSSNTAYVGINAAKYGAGLGGLVGGSAGNATSSTAIKTGDTVMLVAQYIWNATTSKYDGVNFWLNPTSSTPGAATASVTGYTSGPSVLNGLYLNYANLGTSEVKFDSFLVGTTFADVVLVPEPSVFGLAAVGGLLLAVRRRKVVGARA